MNTAPLTVGLIGAGGITQAHLPAWLELGARVTVYSIAGAEALAKQFDIREVSTLEELLATCDIVDICTPTTTHKFFAEAALSAGKNVVCEKPLALTAIEAEEMGASAAAADRQLYPAHVVRFFPEYVQAKMSVESGVIGSVAISRFSRIGEYPSWADWFSDDKESGGIVMDLMIHDLDIARWISGEVTEVYAVRSAAVAAADTPNQVTAQVILTHESGALSYVTGVWGAPGITFSTGFSIAGSLGVLTHDSREDQSLRLDLNTATGKRMTRPETSLMESPYLSELREFSQAMAGGPTPRVSVEDGARAIDIAAAANASIASGRSVFLRREDVAA